MFEKSKFKKKYPLFSEYITDKVKMKKLLEDSLFESFYSDNSNELAEFIHNLKKIYTLDEISLIIVDLIENCRWELIKRYHDNLKYFFSAAREFDGSLDILKNIDWNVIKKNSSFLDIKEIVLDMLFKKIYTTSYVIAGKDVMQIYENEEFYIKKKLYFIMKNNNLDFFVFLMNFLQDHKVKIDNLDLIFSEEIDDRIYSPILKDKLGDKFFEKFINYYFKYSTYRDKKVISKLLDSGNYQLLCDMLYLDEEGCYESIKDNETQNDIFNIRNLAISDLIAIIYRHFSSKDILDYKYFEKLKMCIGDKQFNLFYSKYQEELDFLSLLSFEKFSQLSIEEKRNLYNKVLSFNDDEKQLLSDSIEKINYEMIKLYQQLFAEAFNKSQDIINKSVLQQVSDSKGNAHNIKIYELKDNESFSFLITAMHNQARDGFMNMYNRPAHKLTINNPENFCKDLPNGSDIISTSMINYQFIETFVGPDADVMYVFSDLLAEDIVGICDRDAALSPKLDGKIDIFKKSNPMSPQELMFKSQMNKKYNEVALRRKHLNGKKIMPTAILCFDKINDVSIKHAEYFNIPIIVINTKTYRYLSHYTKNPKVSVKKFRINN